MATLRLCAPFRSTLLSQSNATLNQAGLVRLGLGHGLRGGVRRLSSPAGKASSIFVQHPGVGKWLVGMSGAVALLVSVGGITRLTRSGLSIVEWKPISGFLPPIGAEDWQSEFDKYKAFPEFQLVNKDMSIEEFKHIYFWEYIHRVLGRLVGLGFAGGMIYHRRVLTGRLLAACSALLLGIGAQGALGWYMVKSGLEHNTLEYEPRVKATRLAAHLGAAFLLFSGMLWTGLGHLLPISGATASSPEVAALASRFLPWSKLVTGMVFGTAMSGALVAGIRAGHSYNTFPLMGGRVVPKEYLDLEPLDRNFIENDACVQFNHRVLAISTFAAVTALFAKLRKHSAALPKRTNVAAIHIMAFSGIQVSLGIATLLLFVPTHLAATHQLGSLAVLGSALWLTRELKFLAHLR